MQFKKDKINLVLKIRIVNLKRSKNSDRKRGAKWGLWGVLVTFYFLTWVMIT